MYPILIEFGSVRVPSYGAMLGVAFLAGIFLLDRELKSKKIEKQMPNLAYTLGFAALLGGVIGARFFYALGNMDKFDYSFWLALLPGGGVVWYGGLFGAIFACLIVIQRHDLPRAFIADAAAPSIAIGHAIGRLGCFLAGDDYGKPTQVAWALAFPNGSPPTNIQVHPTQIYESIVFLGIFAILLLLRKRLQEGYLFWLFILMSATERFFIEFIRVNQVMWGGLTIHQLISFGLILFSSSLFIRRYVKRNKPSLQFSKKFRRARKTAAKFEGHP